MEKRFNKALLLCPEKYSLFNSLFDILSDIALTVSACDISTVIRRTDLKINSQMFRLPFKIRHKWEAFFLKRINRVLLDIINEFNP